MLEYPEELFDEIKSVDPVLDRKIKFYQNQLYKLNQTYALDYIVSCTHCDKKDKYMVRRRTILKNVVFARIEQIRLIKRKPKLKDLLEFFRGKDKEFAAKKLRQLYSNNNGIIK